MSRKLRHIHPHQLVEVTCRTFQGRYLLAPSQELNRRLLGVLGRAQRRTGMKIHAFAVLSNHAHYLLAPRSLDQLVRFMRYLQTNLSKEIQDLHEWDGPVWDGRYQCIPISDEDDAHIARLRYILAHGVKEDLVVRVRDWPGAHCARAVVGGEPLRGVWYDRSRLYELRRTRRGKDATREDVAETETVVLSPLPCWQGLSGEELRTRFATLVEAIDLEAAERRAAEGIRIRPLDAVKPRARPENFTPTPAPLFHTATQAAWKELRDAYVEFVAAFRDAAKLLREGVEEPNFPEGCFPPGLPFVPHGGVGSAGG